MSTGSGSYGVLSKSQQFRPGQTAQMKPNPRPQLTPAVSSPFVRRVLVFTHRRSRQAFLLVFLSSKFEMLSQYTSSYLLQSFLRCLAYRRHRSQSIDVPHPPYTRRRGYLFADSVNKVYWIYWRPDFEEENAREIDWHRGECPRRSFLGANRRNLISNRGFDIIRCFILVAILLGCRLDTIESLSTLAP